MREHCTPNLLKGCTSGHVLCNLWDQEIKLPAPLPIILWGQRLGLRILIVGIIHFHEILEKSSGIP